METSLNVLRKYLLLLQLLRGLRQSYAYYQTSQSSFFQFGLVWINPIHLQVTGFYIAYEIKEISKQKYHFGLLGPRHSFAMPSLAFPSFFFQLGSSQVVISLCFLEGKPKKHLLATYSNTVSMVQLRTRIFVHLTRIQKYHNFFVRNKFCIFLCF